MPFPRLHARFRVAFALLLAAALLGAWAAGARPAQAQPAQPDAPAAPDIVGGQPAAPGEYPWQVWLQSPYYNGPFCGGSLVTARWVMTAAHCVEVYYGPVSIRPEDLSVVAGDHDWTVTEGTEQVIGVERIVIHPGWDPSNSDNDIALLKLEADVVLNARVQPIQPAASPADDAALEAGDLSLVTGWGALYPGGPGSNVLMEVGVPIVSNTQCQALQPFFDITDNMICAGLLEGGKDSCQGDSGGPLAVQKSPGVWRLGGLTSFGDGCAKPERPGVYTRVSRYAEWAQSYTGGGAGPQPVRNGNFEAGDNGVWESYSGDGVPLITNSGLPVTPRSGQYVLALGGPAAYYEYAEQALPLDTRAASLRFYYQVRSTQAACDADRVTVYMVAELPSGYENVPLATLPLCEGENSTGWEAASLPLGDVQGQTVVVRFGYEGGSGASSLFVDDVEVIYPAGDAPLVAEFAPAAGEAGASVVLTGTNFSGVTSVSFGGVSAAFTVNSPTSITAIVPPDALSGPIALSNASGDGETATPFTVLVQLRVARAGTGTGRVVNTAAGIDCGAVCSGLVERRSDLVLEAAAAPGSAFTGWLGCGDEPVCSPALEGSQTVTATFKVGLDRPLTVMGERMNFEPLAFSADTGLSPVGSCAWDFGDGWVTVCGVPVGAASAQEDLSVTHVYAGPGDYTVALTAANAAGSYTVTTTLTISPTNKILSFLSWIGK